MLIIPLHKRPTAENFPWVTLALILANVFVFVFLQSGDEAVVARAAGFYRSSGLYATELPRYYAFARGRADHERFLRALDDRLADPQQRAQLALMVVQQDAPFRAALAADPPFADDSGKQDDWRAQRAQLERIWAQQVTDRFMMRYHAFEPTRIFSAMFLHAGPGHLIGNMVFLALLGLLVEGALGPGLFLAVYLLAGFGGGALSVLRHFGQDGAGLGASGAIAGLMGAYCVLWGLRKVRFFGGSSSSSTT